ncbi:hypothetical protein JJ685_23170 [Ramlibacter monticola]|uniref:Uncharacterized protein n=1 Tax=Ramlibacter monticola TaxID=1926872 RepID=A0A936Z322_9BURK|nr:hypothetical protein [Ramlibacter monticola]MBL0394059.1 hypothetical protein [Ramlibacter monticola]
MSTPHRHSALGARAGAAASVQESSEEDQGFGRYCPTGLLASFALLMAGRGRCVNTDMMLGDREYAMWQLACARATDDPELEAIATRLFAYFDDPQHSAMPVLGTA